MPVPLSYRLSTPTASEFSWPLVYIAPSWFCGTRVCEPRKDKLRGAFQPQASDVVTLRDLDEKRSFVQHALSPLARYCSKQPQTRPHSKGGMETPTSARGVSRVITFPAVLLNRHKARLEGGQGRPSEQVTFKKNPEEVRREAEQRASKGRDRSGKPRGENKAGR